MIAAQLAKVPTFDHFEARELNALASITKARRYSKGEYIIKQGSRPDGVHIILSGMVRISRITAAGAILVLGEIGVGAVFGTLAAIDKGIRGADCIAKTEVESAFIPLSDFDELMAGKSSLALQVQAAVLRSVFAELRGTNKHLSELLALEPYFIMKPV